MTRNCSLVLTQSEDIVINLFKTQNYLPGNNDSHTYERLVESNSVFLSLLHPLGERYHVVDVPYEQSYNKYIVASLYSLSQYLETCCIASKKNTSFISLDELRLKSSRYYTDKSSYVVLSDIVWAYFT